VSRQTILAILATIVLLVIVLGTVVLAAWSPGEITEIGMEELGNSMFEEYGITFLVVGVLMFAAMLGGVFLAKEDDR